MLLLAPRHWGAHLLMVLALAAAIALGVWQYDVWGAHRAAEARDLSHARAVPLGSVLGGDDVLTGDNLGRPVTLRGRWLPEGTLYVSDRRQDGRTGYWVMTPVLVDGSSAMPVVRGWSATPDAPRPSGDVELTGWLQASEATTGPDQDPSDDVIPQMRIPSIVEHVDADLYSAYVVTRDGGGAATAGLTQVTPSSIPKVSGTTSLRNLLYAFQWWIFGGFAVYIWVRWCRDVLEGARAREPEPERVPSGA